MTPQKRPYDPSRIFWLIVLAVAVAYFLSHDECAQAVGAAGLFGWMIRA